ncbi:MAG: hypothetical protein ACFFA6_15965 [Promethearchaeota archaeon]
MSDGLFKPLELSCPSCGAEKTVNVPNSLFSNKQYGHVKIQVPQGAVCPDHVFVVFIDVKGRIIGYEAIDLSISSPTVKPTDAIRDESTKTLTLNNLIDRLGFKCVAGLIHARLFNYPSYIITSNGVIAKLDEINEVFNELIPEMYKSNRTLKIIEFDGEIYPLPTYFYALVQNQRRTAFLINPHSHIIQLPWKIDLELEKSLIKSALEKEDQNEQWKFLAYYITKFIEEVEFSLSIIKDVKKISKKELLKRLKEKLITSTFTKSRVISIKEFIRRRISADMAQKIQV